MDRRSVLKSLAALAVAPLDAMVPSEPKKHGIVFDGVDDVIHITREELISSGLPTKPLVWIYATSEGFNYWDGEKFVKAKIIQ